MAKRKWAVALLAVFVASGTAWAADHPIPGQVTVIKQAKLAKFVAKNKPILPALFPTPVPGSVEDPTLYGAEVRFFDTQPDGAGEFVHSLPADGWRALGNPPGSQGYKYLGAAAGDSVCKIALIKGKVIKATCKSPAIPLDPPFAGVDGGNAGVILGVPSGSTAAAIRYCLEFGGTAKRNDTTAFQRRDAAAPPDCPEVAPAPTPTPVCGNNVREGTEACDGADATACPGDCLPDCTCATCPSGGGDSTVCYWFSAFGPPGGPCYACCAAYGCLSACSVAAGVYGCDDPGWNDSCSSAANAAGCTPECCPPW